MRRITNPLTALALAALLLGAPAALAESQSAKAEREAEIETLLAELAQDDLETWEATENKIIGLWSRSGSATADLLLQRGQDAMEAEDYATALDHLTALTDHAPDFAEGWHARATVFYLTEEFGLALDDLQRALRLNPRHFGALTGLGIVFDHLGDPRAALNALRRAEALNPHRDNIQDLIIRMRRQIGEATL